MTTNMKIHLGCGQLYLDNYVNIDYPPSEHTVQDKSIADVHADILSLRYPFESVDEVRLHHVFEHFPRPVACALLAAWHSWLREGGIVRIEVPDFTKTARVLLNPLNSFKKQALAERHLFGSHEAPWAVHCEAYTVRFLEAMLDCFGYSIRKIMNNSWKGTYNIEVIAEKNCPVLTRNTLEVGCRTYLANFLVDESEDKLLDIWMNIYRDQVERSWAFNA